MTRPVSRKTVTALTAGVLVIGVGVTLAPTSSAAPANKKFGETVSVDGGTAGTSVPISAGTHDFTFTIKNTSSGPTAYFGSWQISVPTGLTGVSVTGYTAPPNFGTPLWDGTARTITGTSSGPTGSGISQPNSIDVTVQATAPAEGICPSTWTTRVKQSNDFSGSGNDFVGNSVSTPVAGSSRLAWGVQPTDMQYDTTPSPTPTVVAVDACGATVSTSASISLTPRAETGTLASTATPVQMTNGVATLSNLKFTDWEFDTTLTASASGLGSAESDEFHVYQFRKVCTVNATCSTPTTPLTGPAKQNYVSVLADAGANPDVLTVSVKGAATGTCNDTTTAPPIGEVVYLDIDNRAKHVTMRLPKEYVLLDPNNGTPFMEICLDTTVDGALTGYFFTDKAGNQVKIGLMPDCSAVAGVPPCITDRKRKAGDEIITFDLPAGDPAVSWR